MKLGAEVLSEDQITESPEESQLPGPVTFVLTVLGFVMMALSFVTMVLGILEWWIVVPLALLKICGVVHWSWALIASPILIKLALSALSFVLALVMGGAVSIFSSDRKQSWFELTWMAAPLLLVLSFGIFGALVGAGGTFVNSRVFNSKLATAVKYITCSLISVSCYVIWLAGMAVLSHK